MRNWVQTGVGGLFPLRCGYLCGRFGGPQGGGHRSDANEFLAETHLTSRDNRFSSPTRDLDLSRSASLFFPKAAPTRRT